MGDTFCECNHSKLDHVTAYDEHDFESDCFMCDCGYFDEREYPSTRRLTLDEAFATLKSLGISIQFNE